jgi:hypothetical protein
LSFPFVVRRPPFVFAFFTQLICPGILSPGHFNRTQGNVGGYRQRITNGDRDSLLALARETATRFPDAPAMNGAAKAE